MSKTPEQWLEETTPPKKQTIFKLFLGYAPGVGKTFNMLSEGIRRHSRGEDVVIGLVETHGWSGIAELASNWRWFPGARFSIREHRSKKWIWTQSSRVSRKSYWSMNWRTLTLELCRPM